MYECLKHEQLHEAFDFGEVVVFGGSQLDLLFVVVELFVVDFLASVVTFL
jgi:hypothetical protein|tara:strand:- start:912 stop:1061 length:150 start_codon:yes stop_codon:yes gene_type:complete